MEADAAMDALQSAGVAAGAVRRATELLEDGAFVERGYWKVVERAVVGAKPHPLASYRVDGERPGIAMPSPLLGEHNEAVFCGILGKSAEELRDLEDKGVIGDQPIVPG